MGQQILTAFTRSGGHGAVVDLSIDSAKKSIETVNAEVRSSGLPSAELRPYECNTADEEAVKKTFAQIVKDFGRVDVLCTNAGITGGAPVEDYDFKDWKQMLDVNVNGTFLFAKEAGKHMIEKGNQGSILMVSSMSGRIVNRPQKQCAYNTVRCPYPCFALVTLSTSPSRLTNVQSKAATAQMMKSMAAEWAGYGIRVNALSPGYIQTTVNEGEEMEKLSKEWIKDIPLGRVAKPEEFRGTAVYMVSDASSYLTGSEIIVDGGYTIW